MIVYITRSAWESLIEDATLYQFRWYASDTSQGISPYLNHILTHPNVTFTDTRPPHLSQITHHKEWGLGPTEFNPYLDHPEPTIHPTTLNTLAITNALTLQTAHNIKPTRNAHTGVPARVSYVLEVIGRKYLSPTPESYPYLNNPNPLAIAHHRPRPRPFYELDFMGVDGGSMKQVRQRGRPPKSSQYNVLPPTPTTPLDTTPTNDMDTVSAYNEWRVSQGYSPILPKIPRVQKTYTLTPKSIAALKDLAEAHGYSPSNFIEAIAIGILIVTPAEK